MTAKPPHGSPCNSCGYCCRVVMCPLATALFASDNRIVNNQATGPCPALERDGDREVCGLVRDPGRYRLALTLMHGVDKMRAAALFLIGSGHGCDALGEGEQPNVEFAIKMRDDAMAKRRHTDKNLRPWGVTR